MQRVFFYKFVWIESWININLYFYPIQYVYYGIFFIYEL